VESVLQSLRDIEGVLGSFLLDDRGELIAQDMPSLFDQSTLSYASARLSQLRAALESATTAGFDGCTARFGNHLLFLRAAQARTLCVLCPVGTNLNTLQMGLNLVARRVAAVRQSVPVRPLPPAPPAPARISLPPPEEHAEVAPADPGSTTRFFRGRPVP
jgi:predicted regulator of Ras-like GTPase activity (Roadblock/LC7/MglB family)